MHVFLTGDVQVGKSTVLEKVVSALGLSVGGFRTAFGADRAAADRWLYLWNAADAPALDEAHGVVRFTDRKPEVFLDRFNDLGGSALRHARETGVQLILMDECGRFEGQATEFQKELFSTLDGDTPVLGVVRQGYYGWLDKIRNHPKVTVLTVTKENRDSLPNQITDLLNANKK